jgi:hypothetical protein
VTSAKTILLCAIFAFIATASVARSDLLAKGEDWREIPFDVVDQRPLLAARIGEMAGRMMFDTGTPEAVFLNRDAAPLPKGKVVGSGFAASGQPIEVQLHDAPDVQIGGLPFVTGPAVVSGNFGFVEGMFGADYLGFIGTPAVQDGAFVLDHGRGVLTVLRSDAEGVLAVPKPAASEVVAELTFALVPGEQPTSGAFVGDLPVVLDFDTGDHGTFYLRDETRTRLEAEGVLIAKGEDGILSAVTFGGGNFEGLSVRLVQSGGPDDKRPWPGSDALRLGAAFLSDHPSIWNFPAGTITILQPDAGFLAAR